MAKFSLFINNISEGKLFVVCQCWAEIKQDRHKSFLFTSMKTVLQIYTFEQNVVRQRFRVRILKFFIDNQ